MMLVNVAGLIVIALIVWWFWLYRPKVAPDISGDTVIRVANGIYDPARLSIPSGKPATLKFLREDESPCSATVVFADLDISKDLPVGEISEVTLPALSSGEYTFTCQMQMYRGELIVEEKVT